MIGIALIALAYLAQRRANETAITYGGKKPPVKPERQRKTARNDG